MTPGTRAGHGLACLVALLAGCAPGEAWVEDGLRFTESTARPVTGAVVRRVRTEPGDAAFMVSLDTVDIDARVWVASLREQGEGVRYRAEDWWAEPLNYTNAAYSDAIAVFNWPVDGGDPALAPDTRYTVRAEVNEVPATYRVRTVVKQDDDLTRGLVRVRMVLDDEVAARADWVKAIDAAVAVWRADIFDVTGIEIDATFIQGDLPADLSPPGFGSEDVYEALSSGRSPRQVDVVLVSALAGGVGLLGVSGGIPGPVGPSGRSAVAVNMLESAGPDGVFDLAETRLLGETIAHEIGHYLGLFHPMELPFSVIGTQIEQWDALDDTVQCTELIGCATVLANNLMFPTPVCFEDPPDPDTPCVRQTALTVDQEALIQRAVIVE